MDAQEICADLERLDAVRNKENGSANAPYIDEEQQSRLFSSKVDPTTTSSAFLRFFGAGALSGARPPKEVDRPHPNQTKKDLPSFGMRLCGIDGSAASSDIFTGLFATGIESMVQAKDQFCQPRQMNQDEDSSFEQRQNQPGHELRVLDIAEDLKKEAPGLIKRENLIPMIKESRKKVRENRAQRQEGSKSEQRGSVGTRHSNSATAPFIIHDVSDSEEYPSDIDDFLEFARIIVDEQNASFESTSYREFETALRETIEAHFIHDDDDDDSMTSVSSCSGYDGDTRDSRCKLQEDTPTPPPSLYRFVSTCADKLAYKDSGAVWDLKKGTICNNDIDFMAPRTTTSDEETSQDGTAETGSVFALEIKEGKARLKATERGSHSDNDSTINNSAMISLSTISKAQLREKLNLPSAFASDRIDSLPACSKKCKCGEDGDSDNTFATGSSVAVIQRQIKNGNRDVIEKFAFDPLDNSLLSDTSFGPHQKIRKLRFRRKQVQVTEHDESSLDDSETQQSAFTDGMKRTIDNLAHLLSEGGNRDHGNRTGKPKGVDRDVVLQKLHDVAPHLYKAVLARIDSEYTSTAESQQIIAPSKSRPTKTLTTREAAPVNIKESVRVYQQKRPLASKPPFATPFKKVIRTDGRDGTKYKSPHHSSVLQSTGGQRFLNTKETIVPFIASPMRSICIDDSNDADSVQIVNVSRGSFWSDVLDVAENETNRDSEDDNPSDEVPSISIDDSETSIVFTVDDYKIGSFTDSQGQFLDVMVEEFLATKIDRFNCLMRERQMILARMKNVFNELRRTPACLLRKSGFADNHRNSLCLSIDEDVDAPSVQRGRALIRKIQRKRQAMRLARQREEQIIRTRYHVPPQGLPVQSAQLSSVPKDSPRDPQHDKCKEFVIEARDDSQGEFRLEEFLTSPILEPSPSPTSLPQSITSKNAIRHVKEKRKILKAVGRSAVPVEKKALHESMDLAFETDESIWTCASKPGLTPHSKQPMIISFRKKPKKKEHNYRALPDQHSSFSGSQEMKSVDILQALAPPSPQSPIRDYRVYTKSFDVANDIAFLCEVASGDLSGDEGQVHVFSDTENSRSSSQMEPVALRDDFNAPLIRTGITFEAANNEDDDVFVNIRKKNSPTSIADYFSECNMFRREKVATAFERVCNDTHLTEDDQFVHNAMDLFMLDEEEEEDVRIFDDIEFFTQTRYFV